MDQLLMKRVLELNRSVETLAALGAWAQVRAAGTPSDPEQWARLEAIALAEGVQLQLAPEEAAPALAMLRAFFEQATDLLRHPIRAPGWEPDDVLLQNQGKGSASVSQVLSQLAPQLFGLNERLARPGARFLDVGTGAGWLAIRFAELFPLVEVVGIDLMPRAVALARANIAQVGLASRISVRQQNVTALDEVAQYDLIWLPGPFLPREVAKVAIERAAKALTPGGVLVFGQYGDAGDATSRALAELRALRSGGHPWTFGDLEQATTSAGLTGGKELTSALAPLRVFAAQRGAR